MNYEANLQRLTQEVEAAARGDRLPEASKLDTPTVDLEVPAEVEDLIAQRVNANNAYAAHVGSMLDQQIEAATSAKEQVFSERDRENEAVREFLISTHRRAVFARQGLENTAQLLDR